ncbi:hypothetical protein D3C81_2172640 [compost metagenome]
MSESWATAMPPTGWSAQGAGLVGIQVQSFWPNCHWPQSAEIFHLPITVSRGELSSGLAVPQVGRDAAIRAQSLAIGASVP